MSLASPIGDEDPDLPWITPANLRKTQASDARHAGAPKETTRVGCITTDYAMQSVLLQMGLKLLSVEGMVMRSVKHWILRCSGCFHLEPDTAKQFFGDKALREQAKALSQQINEAMSVARKNAKAREEVVRRRGF